MEANVEHCQLYGVRGQDQEGIDIYARQRLTEKYRVYQCKRVKDFGVAHIKNAVSKFIEGKKGKWISQTDTFVLCTQVSLNRTELADEIETQSKLLKNEGVTFLPWGSDQLSLALKDKPELVDDFFGRAWVAAFCGQEQADSLGVRQKAEVIVENYREWLSQKTAHLKVPGFPLQRELSIKTNWIPLQAKLREGDKTSFDAEFIPTLYRLSVVIGAPGAGKSTLLRRLAHCLSAAGKRVIFIRLPDVKKLLDSDKSEGFEWAILKAAADNSAFNDKELRLALSTPDYLLADGLDECKSDRANIADKLDAWVANSSTKVVITTRPSDESSLLPGWQHIKLSPLNKPDILEYSQQLLAAYCEDAAKVQERLDSLHRQLQDSTNASLAVQNPLLLGFIVQLIAEDVEIGQNRTELYSNIIKLASKRPPLDRKPIEFSERDAQRIFEIAGWRLLHKPELAADELINSIIEELESRGYTLREAEEKAEDGVEFWQNRCIFKRYSLGTQDIISFVHPTLCEYAAGRYASRLSDEKLCQWLERVRRKPEWRESILFCAGSGAAEGIITYLLELDNPEDPASKEVLLATDILAEFKKPSLELLKLVANQIKLRLKSSNSSVSCEVLEAALKLTNLAPEIIGSIAQSLLNDTQPWTYLAAVRICLVFGDKYIDLDTVTEIVDTIITQVIQSKRISRVIVTLPSKPSNIKHIDANSLLEGRDIEIEEDWQGQWNLWNQVVLEGVELLMRKQPGIETDRRIKQVLEEGLFTFFTNSSMEFYLREYVLKNLEEDERQEHAKRLLPLSSARLVKQAKAFYETFDDTSWPDFRELKRDWEANQAILEAVIRVTDNTTSEAILPKPQSQELVAFAILLRGMRWSKVRACDWSLINAPFDLDAVDAVFKGAIAAMKIDSPTLATQAKFALQDIQHDLDMIESVLRSETNDNEKEWALQQTIKKITDNPFAWSISSSQIPKVPVEPKWELAKNTDITSKDLVHALNHPSPGIFMNAALLLMHGVGGSEGMYLVREFLREKNDLIPKLKEILEDWVQQCLK
ncbi:MAG: NACHT domain-containing protein [Coleofasciculus sp. G1-WW12-02]|uniref:NACHT domain-containing protein n=1 Tax=Coleofasciculus sp. G1-WW12-02 TaxID=3068483 RepID=UPI0032F52C42